MRICDFANFANEVSFMHGVGHFFVFDEKIEDDQRIAVIISVWVHRILRMTPARELLRANSGNLGKERLYESSRAVNIG